MAQERLKSQAEAFWTVVALLFVRAGVIVLLWHPVAQALFSLPPIGYWQAVGLCLLLQSAHK
jgi:NADH:ubiquinone oxidoreductase subunit 3 (subunit A)